MSALQDTLPAALAFQMERTLSLYERDVACLVDSPLDLGLYARVGSHLDQMRICAAELPPVSAPWAEVLIRHFELVYGLWRAQRDPGLQPELRVLHADLLRAAGTLSHRTTQLLPRA